MKSHDVLKISYLERRAFLDVVRGIEVPEPEVTDGFDPVQRDYGLEVKASNSEIPLGHVAFMGDFDQGV